MFPTVPHVRPISTRSSYHLFMLHVSNVGAIELGSDFEAHIDLSISMSLSIGVLEFPSGT